MIFKDLPKYCYGVDLPLSFLAGSQASKEDRSFSSCSPTTAVTSSNARLVIGLDLCRLAADPGQSSSVDELEGVERAEPLKRRDGKH